MVDKNPSNLGDNRMIIDDVRKRTGVQRYKMKTRYSVNQA